MDGEALDKLIRTLTSGMSRARNNADGQTKTGYILIPTQDYDALYYAAYNVKKALEADKDNKKVEGAI